MVAVFDSRPMGAAQVDPVLGGAFVHVLTGEIVSIFDALASAFLLDAGAVDFHDGAAGGEARGHGLRRAKAYGAFFDASMPAGGLYKRGASEAWVQAYCRSVGWLPLICRKYSPPFSAMMRAVSFWQCKGSAVIVLPSKEGIAASSCWATFISQRWVFSF